MSRQAYIRSSVALAATQLFPDIVRTAVISDAKFRHKFGLASDAIVTFGANGVAFQRSSLFGTIRRLFDSATADTSVSDTDGNIWRVEFLRDEIPPKIALARGENRFVVPHLGMLSPDAQVRQSVFRDEAHRVNLPSDAVTMWGALLSGRPLDDDEVGVIQNDFSDTPINTTSAIKAQLGSGKILLDVLVPRSIRYYERLVGKLEDGMRFDDYVTQVATPHVERLINWKNFEGCQLALLLGSHATLSALLRIQAITSDEFDKIINWLTVDGDLMSRAAAAEVGLSLLGANLTLKSSLSGLLSAIVLAEPPKPYDRYALLSSLIMTVYGELARTGILASKPPFWRRMAAIAQAALIERCFVASDGDATGFAKWAMSVRAQFFLAQCFVDLRLEPRWLPEFVLPEQLKDELGGRIWAAASKDTEVVTTVGLRNLLLDDVEGGLRRQLNIPRVFLPGPLEGASDPLAEIPEEHQAMLRADLSEPVIKGSSFFALANGAYLFRIPSDIAGAAADALTRADYRLDCDGDQERLVQLLHGLAAVAAVTRNHELADSLFTVLRKYRRFNPEELGIEESFRVGMIASASRIEPSDWCKCVGGCITDLAFQPIAKDEADRLHSHLVTLCHLVPELWATCGQADAALRSVMNV
jgi:hypothetical protein